jgi:hypothetical protein
MQHLIGWNYLNKMLCTHTNMECMIDHIHLDKHIFGIFFILKE